jgi:hypothetical protein
MNVRPSAGGMIVLLAMLLMLAIMASGCGSSVTAPWETEYHVAPTPGPSPCLQSGTWPRIDVPTPSPDPMTGKCPAGWFR